MIKIAICYASIRNSKDKKKKTRNMLQQLATKIQVTM